MNQCAGCLLYQSRFLLLHLLHQVIYLQYKIAWFLYYLGCIGVNNADEIQDYDHEYVPSDTSENDIKGSSVLHAIIVEELEQWSLERP